MHERSTMPRGRELWVFRPLRLIAVMVVGTVMLSWGQAGAPHDRKDHLGVL